MLPAGPVPTTTTSWRPPGGPATDPSSRRSGAHRMLSSTTMLRTLALVRPDMGDHRSSDATAPLDLFRNAMVGLASLVSRREVYRKPRLPLGA